MTKNVEIEFGAFYKLEFCIFLTFTKDKFYPSLVVVPFPILIDPSLICCTLPTGSNKNKLTISAKNVENAEFPKLAFTFNSLQSL